jgi:glycosyltransferase involved in cell wall biosynthesis
VVLEALSSGAPVISTRSFVADPPTRDLIRWIDHGVFASTPPSRQTHEAIVTDLMAAVKDLWTTKTPQNARHRHDVVAANNSWAKTTERILDVYESVLKAR